MHVALAVAMLQCDVVLGNAQARIKPAATFPPALPPKPRHALIPPPPRREDSDPGLPLREAQLTAAQLVPWLLESTGLQSAET